MDQSKKTMRHFYCRDVLWETFEQMANDFDCSIDYLINEAMRYYARSKNYQTQTAGAQAGAAEPGARPPSLPDSYRPPTGPLRRTSPPPPPPAVVGDVSVSQSGQRRTPSSPPPTPPASLRRPTGSPFPKPAPEPPAAAGPTLYLLFNNQRIPIDKDQFIIGRGSKTSDLAIKDGNIS